MTSLEQSGLELGGGLSLSWVATGAQRCHVSEPDEAEAKLPADSDSYHKVLD